MIHVSIFKGRGAIEEFDLLKWKTVALVIANDYPNVRQVHIGVERLAPKAPRTPYCHIVECD